MAKRFENKVAPECEPKSGDDESSIQTISIGEGKSQTLYFDYSVNSVEYHSLLYHKMWT